MKDLAEIGKQLEKDIEALQEVARAHGGNAVKGAFEHFLNAHPEVEAVRFRQWTPGFNDGDPCLNTLGECEVKMNDEGGDYGDGWYSYPAGDLLRQDMANLDAVLSAVEDQLEAVFGTNHEITVYRDRVETEYYDCGY